MVGHDGMRRGSQAEFSLLVLHPWLGWQARRCKASWSAHRRRAKPMGSEFGEMLLDGNGYPGS